MRELIFAVGTAVFLTWCLLSFNAVIWVVALEAHLWVWFVELDPSGMLLIATVWWCVLVLVITICWWWWLLLCWISREKMSIVFTLVVALLWLPVSVPGCALCLWAGLNFKLGQWLWGRR